MKLFLTLLAITSSLTALGYYSDLPEVVELANSGDYTLIENSRNCPENRWSAKNEVDELRGKDRALCIEKLTIPQNVAFEVSKMEEAELENESDYDQRITSLLAFKKNRFKGAHASLESIKEFAMAMDIPLSHLDSIEFHAEAASERTFSRFDELFLGMTYKSNSQTHQFLVDTFKGQNIQIVSFESGVELYPGGGFYVTHYLFISSDKAVYVKLSWWNS